MSREYVLQPFRSPIDLRIDYARELNEQQLAAATAPPGPALVIAGAGSGKTRTLIYRVAYLLEQGVPPERLLLLTFTNKAAKEMMRRVGEVLGCDLTELWGGTFHSIAHRILRRHLDRIGFQPGFTILDREDTKDTLKLCLDDAEIDIKATRFPKADVLAEIFSLSVNTNRPVGQILVQEYGYFAELSEAIAEVRRRFEARKRVANVMDFDDLLVFWLKLMREHADVAEFYQRRFQFILVDEYQDTNQLQSDLIDLLGSRHHNVMAVGDDSQSIYSWRGANFRNILQFPDRYPGCRIYKIETNYRSTPEILAVANAAIAPNLRQYGKQLSPVRPSGPKPFLVACQTAGEQAAFVAQRLLELRDEGVELNQMAVLYRAHFHALELQLELTRHNIPFSITSGIRFFEQAHIKDLAAYLKFVGNARDEVSFKRVVRLLPGIGGKGAEKLWSGFRRVFETADQHDGSEDRSSRESAGRVETRATGNPKNSESQSHDSAPTASPDHSPLAKALQACAGLAPKKSAVAWAQLAATISQLESEPRCAKPSEMIRLVIEAGYEDHLQETYANYRQRLEDLQQLAVFAHQFNTTEEFLSQLSLLSNLDAEGEHPRGNDSEQVRLSTIHQAKGLEFKAVFLIMLCDGLFPSARSLEQSESEEEERRLFYVAITRARDELYLIYPLVRGAYGYSGDTIQRASRFLRDLPEEVVEEMNLVSFNPYR